MKIGGEGGTRSWGSKGGQEAIWTEITRDRSLCDETRQKSTNDSQESRIKKKKQNKTMTGETSVPVSNILSHSLRPQMYHVQATAQPSAISQPL